MPAQPLSSVRRSVGFSFGSGFVDSKPELAQFIGRAIAVWSDVEIQVARLAIILLGVRSKRAIAMYLALQSVRLQTQMLDIVANEVLGKRDYTLFRAVMSVYQARAEIRHKFAHHLWGVPNETELPNALLLVDPRYRLERMIHTYRAVYKKQITRTDVGLDRKRIFVYTTTIFEEVIAKFHEIHQIIFQFNSLVSRKNWSSREQLYRWLSVVPSVQAALASQKGSPEDQKTRPKFRQKSPPPKRSGK